MNENFGSGVAIIAYILTILLFLWIIFGSITSETVELELKDDYEAQRIGLEYECDKYCNLKNKIVHQANWDNWDKGFLCTCCDKIYTKDFWGNIYTGCETHRFNRKDWVQRVMEQRKGEEW